MSIFNSLFTLKGREDQSSKGVAAGCSITFSAVPGKERYLFNVNGFSDLASIIEAKSILTGTLSTASGDATVTGTGTAFLTELYAGRLVRITDTSEYLTVLSVTDNTHFEATVNSASNEASSTGYVVSRLSLGAGSFSWDGEGTVKGVIGKPLIVSLLSSTADCQLQGIGACI